MLLRVEAFFSLNIYYPIDLPYMVFLKKLDNRSGHFIVNMEGQINGFDKRIFEMLKYTDILKMPSLINLDARYCLPNWSEIVTELNDKNTFYENRSLKFQFFSKKHQFYKYIATYNEVPV
jgi:hypothetical protein